MADIFFTKQVYVEKSASILRCGSAKFFCMF